MGYNPPQLLIYFKTNMASFQLGEDWTNEYKGMNAEEAKNQILAKHPKAQIEIIPQNEYVPEDISLVRVRIRIDGDGNVNSVRTGWMISSYINNCFWIYYVKQSNFSLYWFGAILEKIGIEISNERIQYFKNIPPTYDD